MGSQGTGPGISCSAVMSDLATELRHLQLADEHIEQAHRHIAAASERIAADLKLGRQIGASVRSLETLKDTLKVLQEHRSLILQTIQDLRDGKH